MKTTCFICRGIGEHKNGIMCNLCTGTGKIAITRELVESCIRHWQFLENYLLYTALRAYCEITGQYNGWGYDSIEIGEINQNEIIFERVSYGERDTVMMPIQFIYDENFREEIKLTYEALHQDKAMQEACADVKEREERRKLYEQLKEEFGDA